MTKIKTQEDEDIFANKIEALASQIIDLIDEHTDEAIMKIPEVNKQMKDLIEEYKNDKTI